MMKTEVSVVLPTYKEAANLEELLSRVYRALHETRRTFEVLIVDDNSCDGTEELVARLQEQYANLRLMVRRDERGLSSAVLCGFRAAAGEILICMDADLSHPPERLPAMVDSFISEQCEFVLGSRYVPGGSLDEHWHWTRWLASRTATLLARPFVHVKDPMSGFFAIRREVFDRGRALSPIGFKIGLELMVKCGCRYICEIPIHFSDRNAGKSKFGLTEQINYLRHLIRMAGFRLATAVR